MEDQKWLRRYKSGAVQKLSNRLPENQIDKMFHELSQGRWFICTFIFQLQ